MIEHINETSILKPQLEHQTKQIQQLIRRLKRVHLKNRRSINWIGSAWKWIAGSPDATDWDTIIKSQNELISNNNEQYKVNSKLMETTNEMLQQYNKIISHIDSHITDKYEQMLFNRMSLLKSEINEIVLAEHLAKRGIINTNLLDKEEINQLIAQIETLPYENEIEAIEYAEPLIVVKETTLLYIISLPKTSINEYNHVIIRPTTRNRKQVYLDFEELLVNQVEEFGIKEKCNSIKNLTICKESQLEKLPTDHCISRLIRGASAKCDYKFNKEEKIEIINDDTIFLDNFNGELFENNSSRQLNGSFVVQYSNETIKIKEKQFINKQIKTFQVLPPIFQAHPVEGKLKLDVEYLHDLHLTNRKQLQNILTNNGISLATDISIITVLIIVSVIFIVFKLKGNNKPKVEIAHPTLVPITTTSSIQDLQPIKINL